MGRDSKEPEIFVAKDVCPVCGKNSLELRWSETEIPSFGRCILLSMKCESCGYKSSTSWPLSSRGPIRYVLAVENPKDIYAKIVKSPTGTIKIPELSILIKPGPSSNSFITNVEGILERVKRAIMALLFGVESEEERKKYQEYLQTLEKAKRGEMKFTVIVEDPYGISRIEHEDREKVREEKYHPKNE
ncbi:MAG: ZPR1 zinc finger domain-containing protein [Candidatus Baldrarchaeia archaeon]